MKHKSGFSLIELLVVSTIIIVLSMIGMVSFSSSGKTARDNRRKTDMEVLRQSMVLYRAENGGYPANVADYDGALGVLVDGGYISDPTPADPSNKPDFSYTGSSDVTSFCFCAKLEKDQGANMGSNCSLIISANDPYYCVKNP